RFTAWPIVDGRSDELRASWGSIAKQCAGICVWQNRPFRSPALRRERIENQPFRSPGNKQGRHSQNQPFREENLFLKQWESQVADKRIHGTTRKQVETCFTE